MWYIADETDGAFSCRDLITGEIRVSVRTDPYTRGRLSCGDVFVGRVVEFKDGAEIFGVGPHTLSRKGADQVVTRSRMALKTDQVTPELLRGHRGGFVVQREWKASARARR